MKANGEVEGCDHMSALVPNRDWRVEWEKQALKGKRNPHILFKGDQHKYPVPGDKLKIGDKEEKYEDLAVETTNPFKVKKPKLCLRLRVLGEDLQPMAGARYQLKIVGDKTEENEKIETLGADASIERDIEEGSAKEGALTLWLKGDSDDSGDDAGDDSEVGGKLEMRLSIGKLNPILAPDAPCSKCATGVQARLNNLGFESGPVDGLIGPITKGAIRRFQRRFKPLAVDGIAGPLTQGKLEEVHDRNTKIAPSPKKT